MDTQLLYDASTTAIDSKSDKLHSLSTDIWQHPEENYQEKHAHHALVEFLENEGFQIQPNFLLPTAFRAQYSPPQGDEDVTVALLCEYDALPVIGHACGHNLIAEAGVGAALGVKSALDSLTGSGIRARVVVLGTPAEEGGGGKIKLIELGAFKDVDFAIMSHPSRHDMFIPNMLAVSSIKATFEGHEAHAAAAPWEGINALDAAVAAYNNVSRFRQQMKPTWRVHGIFTEAGTKPNIIPARASLEYLVRAPTRAEVNILEESITRCLESAALGANCRITYKWDEYSSYDDVISNSPMANVYKKHAESMGVVYKDDVQKLLGGSTDAGNVSRVVPTIHPIFSIPTDAINHTKEFALAAGSPDSQRNTLISAKSMANTALDLMANAGLRQCARRDFTRRVRERDV